MSDQENIPSNKSGNRPFRDVLEASMQRRSILKGSLGVAATSFFATTATMAAGKDKNKLMDFTPVAVADGNGPNPVVSPEYNMDIILPWGDPMEPSGPAYSYPPTSADQAQQIGIGHDGMWFFPIMENGKDRYGWNENRGNNPWQDRNFANGPGNQHGVLCINFEFGGNSTVLGKGAPESLEDVRVSQHAHGVGVIEIARRPGRNGSWAPVQSELSRRIHVNTPVTYSGPAAGSTMLQTPAGNIPLGTVNNCAHGYTPWGTYLTCEENFNGYFGASDGLSPTESQARYGFSSSGFGYGWHEFDKRFDLSDPDYVNEENRFGWVVEIDPFDATAMPVKRTALGRFKHEGATTHVDDQGRVVVYMGDDQRFDYIYKYVSQDNWQYMMSQGIHPLDHGTLYVARFDDNGTGEWLELGMSNPDIAYQSSPGGEITFDNLEKILVHARIAADLAGATPMDRPEWTTVDPDGRVYCTLTNNSQRTVADAANPLAPNSDGHIIRWTETYGHGGTAFEWEIYVIAQETHGTEESFADPDGIWADPDGRVFIQTDGGQKDGLNNQMLVADGRDSYGNVEIRRLLTGVGGCEITGLAVTPDRRTMFVNVQHPGNGNPALTNFPVPGQGGPEVPRDATIVITRKDGGVIGS